MVLVKKSLAYLAQKIVQFLHELSCSLNFLTFKGILRLFRSKELEMVDLKA